MARKGLKNGRGGQVTSRGCRNVKELVETV